MGYDLKNMVGYHIAFVADLSLLAVLFILWKPLTLLLIYVELWLRIGALSFQVSALSIYQQIFTAVTDRVPKNVHISLKNPSKLTLKERKEEQLWECLRCVFSLSLLLRFISGRAATFETRKQDRLSRVSFLYRVFRHVI